jgi:hypothetical protein
MLFCDSPQSDSVVVNDPRATRAPDEPPLEKPLLSFQH